MLISNNVIFYIFTFLLIIGIFLFLCHYYIKKKKLTSQYVTLAIGECFIGFILFIYGINFFPIIILLVGCILIYQGVTLLFSLQLSKKQLKTTIFSLLICLIVIILLDGQYLIRGSLYRLNANFTNTPILVIDDGEDIAQMPRPKLGTLIVFSPLFKTIPSCGFFAGQTELELPIRLDCTRLYWGKSMADFDRKLSPNYELLGLSFLGRHQSRLTKETIMDINDLCEQTNSCLNSKNRLVALTERESWQDVYQWGKKQDIILDLDKLGYQEKNDLINIIAKDMKNAYREKIELFIARATKAEKESFAFYDVSERTHFSIYERKVSRSEDTDTLWRLALSYIKEANLRENNVKSNYYLPNGIVVDITTSPAGGDQLNYQPDLVHLNTYQLVLQILSILILPLLILSLILRYFKYKAP